MRAISADLQPAHHNVETAFALNLALQPVEKVAFEFRDLPATQAGHVDVIALRSAFIEMLLSLHVHKVEFIHQSVPFQKTESAINGDPVYAGIDLSCLTKNLSGVQMLLGSFDHAQNCPALVRETKTARHQFRLKIPGSFGLG